MITYILYRPSTKMILLFNLLLQCCQSPLHAIEEEAISLQQTPSRAGVQQQSFSVETMITPVADFSGTTPASNACAHTPARRSTSCSDLALLNTYAPVVTPPSTDAVDKHAQTDVPSRDKKFSDLQYLIASDAGSPLAYKESLAQSINCDGQDCASPRMNDLDSSSRQRQLEELPGCDGQDYAPLPKENAINVSRGQEQAELPEQLARGNGSNDGPLSNTNSLDLSGGQEAIAAVARHLLLASESLPDSADEELDQQASCPGQDCAPHNTNVADLSGGQRPMAVAHRPVLASASLFDSAHEESDQQADCPGQDCAPRAYYEGI